MRPNTEINALKAAAYSELPADAVWSSSFGNPGEGGFTEYYRRPNGERWIISNGPWHLLEWEFDWHCQRVEEREPIIPPGYALVQMVVDVASGQKWLNAAACVPVDLALQDRDRLEYDHGYPARVVYPKEH